jgi:pyridoxal phosphate enzyme (YggS family)
VSELGDRYFEVIERIDAAAVGAGRASSEVTLVVITKNHPAQLVLDLLELGAKDFGENRDQEAAPKAEQVRATSTVEHRWHFVGQLQSNKVKSALEYSSVLHSLDRESLLQALVKQQISKPLDVFIQLNLTDDPGRGGIEPKNLEGFAEKVLAAPNLNLIGVMGVAALDREPEVDFETIRNASQKLQVLAPGARFISAGMSGDFEKAIAFGATHVRVGTAITGKRNY